MRKKIALVCILLLACFTRIYGINWDQHQHLHPDERFLTMVATSSRVPSSFSEYLNPETSTLNPYNQGFSFFVYGTFPVSLVKILAVHLGMDTYYDITLLGRLISALTDVGTLLMLYLLIRIWQKRYRLPEWLPYLSAFLYAISVLPIQQSHFFTVDTFAAFFISISFFVSSLYIENRRGIYIVVGALGVGLALGSKVSSLYSIPLIGMFYLMGMLSGKDALNLKYTRMVGHTVLAVFVSYIMLRLADPRIFASASWLSVMPNPQFTGNIAELKRLTDITAPFPPTLQWVTKKPILFPLQNMALFGVGLPYFILSCVGLLMALLSKKREIVLTGVWIIGFFIYQGNQNIMTMRYFYVLYPFLAFFAGWVILEAAEGLSESRKKLAILTMCVLLSIWPYGFMSIYRHPHSRVQASSWIYENIPAGSVILVEHWDDALPLSFPADQSHQFPRLSNQYKIVEQPVFDPDSQQKQMIIEKNLLTADYYILSSNRGYGSILSVPGRYPYTSSMYADLLDNRTAYKKVAEFSTDPYIAFGDKKFVLSDRESEEAFTVYDHPTVLIFKNTEKSPR